MSDTIEDNNEPGTPPLDAPVPVPAPGPAAQAALANPSKIWSGKELADALGLKAGSSQFDVYMAYQGRGTSGQKRLATGMHERITRNVQHAESVVRDMKAKAARPTGNAA